MKFSLHKFWSRKLNIPDKDREALGEARIDAFNDRVASINQLFFDGQITLAQWEAQMREAISSLHTGMAAIGAGGWENMTASMWGSVGAEIKKQFTFLHSWALELQALMNSGSEISLDLLNFRGTLYGKASRATFERARLALQGVDAKVLPAIPGDGTTDCYTGCQCHWSISVVGASSFPLTDYNATWVLGIAEHCDTCKARANSWTPIEVRNGTLGTFSTFGTFRN